MIKIAKISLQQNLENLLLFFIVFNVHNETADGRDLKPSIYIYIYILP